MNSIHNNGENDKSLNEDLDKLGNVYGRLEQDEPPELLDQAILNSAHRAVEKKPHWMQFGWLHGLTTAAVFVLAFSIILNQREPVPDYENGMRNNETVRLQREKVAKKQSVGRSDKAVDELRMEMKPKGEGQRDMLQSVPVAAAPESATVETSPDDMAEQPVIEAQRSRYVSDSLQGKTDSDANDAPARELILEETMMDEADLMVDSPQAGAISKQTRPATVAEPEASEMKARFRTDSEIEQKILDIIKLKQRGDETWKTELETFKSNYPDYPLPDELIN
jgi:hypothetical protein